MVTAKDDERFMRMALRLAKRGYGLTSPNPMVGAVLVKAGRIIGRGWHQAVGKNHAEVEAIQNAQKRRQNISGATLYVTLEPCCTYGRTPPCTDAIISAGITKVVAGCSDPNPSHCGKGLSRLRQAGLQVRISALGTECQVMNEAFNHWIVHRTPFITVKAAMTLDGKIATPSGESKWITGDKARQYAMRLRQGTDAILVGINTVLADDPSLTIRNGASKGRKQKTTEHTRQPRRIVLDGLARTPLDAKLLNDSYASLTTIVVTKEAAKARIEALMKRAHVMILPAERTGHDSSHASVNLRGLIKSLGAENVTALLVEGGGEVNASFLLQRLAHRIEFFYAPKVLGGRSAVPAVAGKGVDSLHSALRLEEVEWRKLGPDLLLRAKISSGRT